MKHTTLAIGFLLAGWLVGPPAALAAPPNSPAKPGPKGVEFFEKKIRPVLAEHCYACHSADARKNQKLKGGLLLDTRDGLLRGGDSGAALVPGKPAEGTLPKALRHDGDVKMPPKGKLPDAVVADFEAWVKMGAPDPRDGKAGTTGTGIDLDAGRKFWAFRPPRRHAPPAVKDAAWPRTDIDRFVLAELEKRGLKPVAPAAKQDWIRRATFDLTGLPPTPEQVEAFEKDTTPEADKTVVDRLLASPHYGERWGRYWLDLARYTDDLGGTVGPVAAPNAWRYRDWVVKAFNADMPYDRFVRLQLAGDLIPDPATDYSERLGGLGYQGLGQRFSGNAVGMVKKKAADELDDRVDTVTRSLLGLTVSCARCHDHKFDPIPQADYYSLAAAYNGATLSTEVVLDSPQNVAAAEQWRKDVADRKARIDKLTQAEARRIGREELARVDAYLLAAFRLRVLAERKAEADPEAVARDDRLRPVFLARWVKLLAAGKPLPLLPDWQTAATAALKVAGKDGAIEPTKELLGETAKVKERVAAALREFDAGKKLSAESDTLLKVFLTNDGSYFRLTTLEVVPLLAPPLRKEYDGLAAELAKLNQTPPPPQPKGSAVTGGGQPMRVHVRGNAEVLGDPAPPGFPRVLTKTGAPRPDTFTRLDLANAIASRDNPLTARVWVNRVWMYHFGRGLVGTPGNFGALGEKPTHPELLDTLAVRFVENGWSTKWLHREIVLSAAYRLGGAADPANAAKDADNRYLWRASPRRLDFEAWRDAMLAVAGRLDPQVGGPPFLDLAGQKQLQPEDPANRRRTLYGFISRFKPNPTLTLFDFPEPNVTSDGRTVTTIPQQQLFALNSPFVVAAAKAFAARVEKAGADDGARLRLAWRLAYGRPPTDRESTLARDFLRAAATDAGDGLRPWEQLCHALLTANEFAFLP